jgi:DNA-3-methyladenine glycosylase
MGRDGRLTLEFFQRDAETVARDLIGTILVRQYRGKKYQSRVVETEAYVGPHDLACHAAKGRTGRTDVMFKAGGHAYVYFIYGMYDMLNVVTGGKDDPQAVLIRAAEPVSGWSEKVDLSGPGKLCRGMKITRALNGVERTGDALHFLPRAGGAGAPAIAVSARIGVDYAKEWRDKPLRFYEEGNALVSGRKRRKWRMLNDEWRIKFQGLND